MRVVNLIFDSTRFHPLLAFLWQSVLIRILPKLFPAQLLIADKEHSMVSLLRQGIEEGRRRFIFVGKSASFWDGIGEVMHWPQETRNLLEIGFWPLSWADLILITGKVTPLQSSWLRLFKSGPTCPVDIAQVQATDAESNKKIFYFWSHCRLQLVACNHSKRLELILKPWLILAAIKQWLKCLPKIHYLVDQQPAFSRISYDYLIRFHHAEMDIRRIDPKDLIGPLKFSLRLHRGMAFYCNLLQMLWHQLHTGYLPAEIPLQSSLKEFQIKTQDSQILILTANQSILAQTVQLEILRKAFPLIVPLEPYKSSESLEEMVKKMPTGNAIATRNTCKKQGRKAIGGASKGKDICL